MQRADGADPGTVPDADAWARAAISTLVALPAVRRVGLALVEGGGRRLRFTASDRPDDGELDWCHVDAYEDVPLNTAVRTGTPVFGALEALADRYAVFVGRQDPDRTSALAAVPISGAGQTVGGYVLFFDSPQDFAEEQRLHLTSVGADLGAVLRRAQRAAQRSGSPLADEPAPPGALVAFHDVPPDPTAVGRARRFLQGTLDAWRVEEDAVDSAVLCLSELVTNALIHTHTGCEIRVVLEDGVLTTAVRDRGHGPSSTSVATDDDPLRVHGRGLQVVDALASRWGSELDAVGTTVWFVLEV